MAHTQFTGEPVIRVLRAQVAYPGGVARCCDLASPHSCPGGCAAGADGDGGSLQTPFRAARCDEYTVRDNAWTCCHTLYIYTHFMAFRGGQNVTFDKAWLAQLLQPAVTFKQKYGQLTAHSVLASLKAGEEFARNFRRHSSVTVISTTSVSNLFVS